MFAAALSYLFWTAAVLTLIGCVIAVIAMLDRKRYDRQRNAPDHFPVFHEERK